MPETDLTTLLNGISESMDQMKVDVEDLQHDITVLANAFDDLDDKIEELDEYLSKLLAERLQQEPKQ